MKKLKPNFYECSMNEIIEFGFVPSHDNVQILFRFGVGDLMIADNNKLSFSVTKNQTLLEIVFAFKTDEGICRIGLRGSNGGSDEDNPPAEPDLKFPEQRRYHFVLPQ